MTQQAFEWGDWQAVIAAHPLESHDPTEWLRYGAALAFEQAKREGATADEVMAVQRDVVRRLVTEVCGLAVQPSVAISSAERGSVRVPCSGFPLALQQRVQAGHAVGGVNNRVIQRQSG